MHSSGHDSAESMELWKVIDLMKQQINDTDQVNKNFLELLAKSATGLGTTLSAGIVTWALRGSSMLASMLSAVPTWRAFDPLPVFSVTKRKKDEDDSTLVDEDNIARILDNTNSGENSHDD